MCNLILQAYFLDESVFWNDQAFVIKISHKVCQFYLEGKLIYGLALNESIVTKLGSLKWGSTV